jgi:hypothetical protein
MTALARLLIRLASWMPTCAFAMSQERADRAIEAFWIVVVFSVGIPLLMAWVRRDNRRRLGLKDDPPERQAKP